MVYFLCKASDSGRQNCCFALSLPVRGAWVEITTARPHTRTRGRSPCGERGLKYCHVGKELPACKSLPVRGAWVEIRIV